MIKITQQQILDRWDILPDVLREAMTSEKNSDIIWQKGETLHLADEKIGIIAALAGFVLSGFLHPEDLSKEIQDVLHLNPNIANDISSTLNDRIFSSLKDEIKKIYAPVVQNKPQTLEEIKRPPMSSNMPVAFDQISIRPASRPIGEIKIEPVRPTEIKEVIAPKPTPPKDLPFAPMVRGIQQMPSVPRSANIPLAPSSVPKMNQDISKPQEPPPVMLFKKSEAAPLQNQDIALGANQKNIDMMSSDMMKKSSPVSVPAKLELGNKELVKPQPIKAQIPTPKVVHYSQFQAPQAPTPKPQEKTPSPPTIPVPKPPTINKP